MLNHQDFDILNEMFVKAPVAITICATDASWIRSNPATTILTGYSEAEIINKSKQELSKATNKQSIYYQVQDLISGNIAVIEIATKYTLKNNDTKWMKIIITLGVTGDGKPFLIAVMEDIDVSFRAKIELERKLDEVVKLNELMVNRELRMIELKHKVKQLEIK